MSELERRGEHGFTLLEVLVAFAVLAVVMGALSGIVGQSLGLLLNTRVDQQASRLAEQKVRELVQAAEAGELPDLGVDEGAFEERGEGDLEFRFRVVIEPYAVPRPDGIEPELLEGSGIFTPPTAGGPNAATPAVRRVEVRAYPEDMEPERAEPFVVFLTEPAEAPAGATGGDPNAPNDRIGPQDLNQGLGGIGEALRRLQGGN